MHDAGILFIKVSMPFFCFKGRYLNEQNSNIHAEYGKDI